MNNENKEKKQLVITGTLVTRVACALGAIVCVILMIIDRESYRDFSYMGLMVCCVLHLILVFTNRKSKENGKQEQEKETKGE